MQRAVPWLTLAGALPFAACVLAALLWPQRGGMALNLFIAYGALILSFIGGTRWGAALLSGAGPWRFVEAVLPSLLGLAALATHFRPSIALGLLAGGFLVWWWLDRADPRWPPAYRTLRGVVTSIVVLLHLSWWVLPR
nr:DUF3429 domain-containing protein [Lysobacter sp. CAU 1642]